MGEVKPPRGSPDSMLSPPPPAPPSSSSLFSLTCRASVLTSPSSLTLSPSSPVPSSCSVLLLHPLLDPSLTLSSFFKYFLPSHSVTMESIQHGLWYAAQLSSHSNASIQQIKVRVRWLCHKPFSWFLITKWSWLLTTEADRKQKHDNLIILHIYKYTHPEHALVQSLRPVH